MVELIPKKGERCFPHLELTRWGDEPNGAKEENRTGHNRFVLKTTEAGGFWLETFLGKEPLPFSIITSQSQKSKDLS